MAIDSIISLEGVSVYQRDNLILSEVSLNIHKSEFVYLVGKTGTGKSSLMKTLYADLPLREGKAEVAGYSIPELKHKEIPFLRRKIGIIFQDFQLLNDRSVNENLIFVMKATGWKDEDAMRHRMNEVLDKVGLITKGFKMPHQLSGGEQQRVSIARALINDPELLLADEPTGALDSTTSFEVNRVAAKHGNAAFFAPEIATRPRKGVPPCMTKRSIITPLSRLILTDILCSVRS